MIGRTSIYDSGDFIELLIKHLFRSKDVLAKAKQLGLRGDDTLISVEHGIRVYKTFTDIALEIGSGPIDQTLLGIHLRSKVESREIPETYVDQALMLMVWIYEGDSTTLNPEHFTSNLQAFIKHRRQQRAKTEHEDDVDALTSELNRINVDLTRDDVYAQATVVNPFASLVKKPIHDLVPTGMNRLDTALGGLGYSEFGLIVGFSGGGKTALATNIALQCALRGRKVAYMSLEESFEDLSNRFYAQVFRINYTSLHNGSGYMELETKFGSDDPVIVEQCNMLVSNLKIIGLKGLSPMKPVQLHALLEKEAAESGFTPDLVIVDQLQFLEPDEKIDGEQQWQKEQRVAEDCDKMSHGKIQGKPFALWALHQAKGKLKSNFTNEDISGFKGIIHKPDTVIGIGRATPTSDDFSIFSIKSRHSKNFIVEYKGDLEYMTFSDPPAGAPTTASESSSGSRRRHRGGVNSTPSPVQQMEAIRPPTIEADDLSTRQQLLSPAPN